MALYRGRRVSLNKVMRGDVKKFLSLLKKAHVSSKVNFGSKKNVHKNRIFQLGRNLFGTS